MGGFFFILAILCFLIYFIDKNKTPNNQIEASRQAALEHLHNLPVSDKHVPALPILEAIVLTWLERPINDLSIHPIVDKYISEDIRRNIKLAYYEVDAEKTENCCLGYYHFNERYRKNTSPASIPYIFRMVICKEYGVLYYAPEDMVYKVGNQYAIRNMDRALEEQLMLLKLTFEIPGVIRDVVDDFGRYYVD